MKKQSKPRLSLNQIDSTFAISDADKMRIKGGGGDIIIVIDIIECPPVVHPSQSSTKKP